MEQDRWAEVERILRSVLDLDPDARTPALERACGEDRDLRREVESLLSHETSAGSFLEGIAGDVRPPEAEPPPGSRAGPYRIIRLLASGGMGSVWLAERDDDEYRKQVAVKVIKRGMDTDEFLQRFRQERQVQANLEHPNIVRLLDGGKTGDGRPYLVMEYVEGKPILAHCKERGLSIPDRLRLFCKICGAVHYAHQNLVVHRDLKPGNILVTPDGEPKLLDFGIAKVRSPEGAKQAEVTGTDLRPMTLRYASPEQVRGESVTTATDVYSLGVILYELLVERGPYEVSSERPSDYERAVCDRDPVPPSEAAKRSDLPRTQGFLRGDLDAIVLKALRKEPWLRYPSAEQLSEDVERHLRGFPVLARRGTAGYRAARFVRRHAAGAAAAAVVFLSLVAGIVATLRQASIVERERNAAIAAGARAEVAADRARREARRAERVAHFLQDVLAAASPRSRGRDITAEQALDRASARVQQEFGDDPEMESAIHAVVGQTYMALGRYADAGKELSEAVRLIETTGGGNTVALASALSDLGTLAYAKGEHEEARALTERALALNERLLGPEHRDVAKSLNNLGAIARAQGDLDRAEDFARKALHLRRELFGEQHVEVAESLNNLAAVFRARGDLPAAERVATEVLAMRRRLLGDAHPDTIQSLDNLAVILAERADYVAAEPLMREAVTRYEASVGPGHPDLAVALNNLSRVLVAVDDQAGAEASLEKALRIRRESLSPADERTLTTARLLGRCRTALGRFEDAERTLEEARADAEAALGAGHPAVRALIDELVRLYEAWGRPGKAAELRALARAPDSNRTQSAEKPASR